MRSASRNRANTCGIPAQTGVLRTSLLILLFVAISTTVFAGDSHERDNRHDGDGGRVEVSTHDWGTITAPTFGTSESGAYAGAELFAGPNKFGSYFAGVLPSGAFAKPAGQTIQVGMNPLGVVLTPDGKFLITSNDDEREGGFASYQSTINTGGYSLSVIDTSTMTVVSQFRSTGLFYIGLQVSGSGPYTLWASGGPDNDVKIFDISSTGSLTPSTPASIKILPITPNNQGFVSSYSASAIPTSGANVFVPTGFSGGGAKITFPAGSALSPDQKFLYVACNGDNSLAVVDTTQKKVVAQVPVGYFPYGVSVSHDGQQVAVSNWGVTEYKFLGATYDGTGTLTALASSGNQPDGFYVPKTQTAGANPLTSSVSILGAPGGDGSQISLLGSVYEGHKLDAKRNVGDTHPSATAIVRRHGEEFLFVTKSNSDALGVIDLKRGRKLEDVDLSPVFVTGGDHDRDDHLRVHGTYPNAIAVSPDKKWMYVAEAGLNSVAVLELRDLDEPKLVGRIPTDWYPTALTVSADGRYLYVANAKGIGEDINPKTTPAPSAPPPTGLASDSRVDSNYIFGSVQKVDLSTVDADNRDVLHNNFAVQKHLDTSVVPVGDGPSKKIKHVFFIIHENKTFDSMLGNQGGHFGNFASTTFNDLNGNPYANLQYTGVSLNTQLLSTKFATAVNYYSNSEESDAGHQFCASGTASDYTEKTLLVKSGRGMLVNKNFEPEDYPENGYIFNNAARHGVSFKDYGALIRISGTDTGTSKPTTKDDPPSGNAGFPQLDASSPVVCPSPFPGAPCVVKTPINDLGDVTTQTQGLGQSYFLKLPILAILGSKNANGEPRLDTNYPGYNFNISDQRRAKEFIQDFDRMVSAGTLPEFLYIYQPNDHTGGLQAPNTSGGSSIVSNGPVQEVADGDIGLGMVVNHIMKSPVYYNSTTGQGSAIFMTYDDAQSTLDHIHPHRTPLILISPYAKPGYLAKRHYISASIVKTEELLLGLPPNNLGDLFATDLRDMFQPQYNGITASDVPVTVTAQYRPSKEGKRIWALVAKLDTSGPDRDSFRLGALARLSMQADELHKQGAKKHHLGSASYKNQQASLYRDALRLVNSPAPRDLDD
ncbi:MAG: bifunctional YncE family protein/alkaline phosphatase family protein [Terriglobales bacterium]